MDAVSANVDDVSALAWVQEELRRSLESTHKSLRRLLKDGDSTFGGDLDAADPALLRNARQHLHQCAGALDLVGLPAAAAVLRGGESLVSRYVARPGRLDRSMIDAIQNASFAVIDFLGQRIAGKPVSPVALFPQYCALHEILGTDRIHPADLWSGSWDGSPLPPEPGVAPRAVDPATTAEFESRVLGLLRSPGPDACQRLGDLSAGLAAGSDSPRTASLWRLAAAFFEGQALELIEPDVYVKRTASRLLAQLRGQQRNPALVNEQLARDLAFFSARAAARASGRAPRLESVRLAGPGEAEAAADYRATTLGLFDPTWVVQARKRVAAARDTWSSVAGGETHRLSGLNEQFSLVADSLRRLVQGGDVLGEALSRAAAQAAQSGAPPPPPLAMEVATSILYLEAALEEGAFSQPLQAERFRRLAQRIAAVQDGGRPEPLEEWMEELYRRVSDRQTMGSVVQELRGSLLASEKLIDEFFRNSGDASVLVPVPGQLQAMRGVLSVLGLGEASQAVLRMREDVEALVLPGGDAAAGLSHFDRLAANLSALSFLIDLLGVQPQSAKAMFRFDPETGLLQSLISRRPAARPETRSAAALEPDSSQTPTATTSAPEAELSPPADLPSVLSPAADVAPRAPGLPASPATAPDLGPLAELTPPPAQPLAPPATAERAGGGELADEELREVFLEEAAEVIEAARQAVAVLRRLPEDVEAGSTVRRAFHTLKGSARMVGLFEFGEAAWAFEQLYNAWIAGHRPAGLELLRATEEALDHLQAWAAAVADGSAQGWRSDDARRVADTLRLEGRRVGFAPAGTPSTADAAPSPAAEVTTEGITEATTEAAAVAAAPRWPEVDVAAPAEAATDLPAPAEVDGLLDVDLAAPAAAADGLGAAMALRHLDLPAPEDLDLDLHLDLDLGPDPDFAGGAASGTPDAEAAPGEPSEPFSPDESIAPAGAAAPAAPAAEIDAIDALEVIVGEAGLADEGPAVPPPATPVPDFTFDLDDGADEPAAVAEAASTAASAAEPGAEPRALPGPARFEDPAGAVDLVDIAELEDLIDLGDAAFPDAPSAAVPESPGSPHPDLAAPPEAQAPVMPWPDMALPESGLGDVPGEVPPLEVGVSPRVDLGDAPIHEDLFPQASPQEPSPPWPAPAADTGSDGFAVAGDAYAEQVKMVGPLQIGIPLFNIYLNEADELSRRLATELSEWALELHRPVGETAIALAHSLAGSSSAVGFSDLSALARTLEHTLEQSGALGGGTPADAALFCEVADEIRRLLHQFAAGFLKVPSQDLLERLQAQAVDIACRLQTQAPGSSAPAPLSGSPLEEGRQDDDAPPFEGAAPAASVEAPELIDPELFAIFEEEAQELLPEVAARLRDWARAPELVHPAAACLRALHTLKGGARLCGALHLGEAAHRLEAAIERLLATGAPQADEVESLLGQADGLSADFEVSRWLAAGGGGGEALQTPAGAQAAGPDDVPVVAGPLLPAPGTLPADATGAAEFPAAAALPDDAAELPPTDAGAFTALPPMGEPPFAGAAERSAEAEAAASASQAGAPESGRDGPAAAELPTPALLPPMPAIDWARFIGPASATSEPTATERAAPLSTSAVRVRAQLLDRLVNQAGEVSIARARLATGLAQFRGSLGDLGENLERLRLQLRDIEIQADTQIGARMEAAKATPQSFDPLEFDRFTRFQELTRMMAESVNDVATVQRSLQRSLESAEDQVATQARLTRDLQEDLLRTRMVEFDGLTERLHRVVRQAARETGKLARLEISGGSIEVDRAVLDRMVGSFEHLLRNSVTHGIEVPAQRLGAGKDETGLVRITLHQEGNDVGIEIADDGVGLDLRRIRARGIAMGLLDPGQPHDDAQLTDLIFQPGFSTAEVVTELAGRGIGMDVVRHEVNALGGRIETHTTPGQGSRFRLVLPLTTAVTRVVMLRCGGTTIAVPATLVEIVRRATPADIRAAYDSGSYEQGGEAVPFFWLGALLEHGGHPENPEARSHMVVVVRSASQRVALHVDEVPGNQEVVVKNLGPQLSRLPGLAGISLLPSGAVALIYNPVALVAVYAAAARRAMADLPEQLPVDTVDPAPLPPLVLVVDDSLTVRRVTQRLLLREGYRVALAKDGLDALERLAEERPSLVLSDIEMPRMDGFDLLRNIRADLRLSGLPVIMITSRIAQKHRDVAAELGADQYLGKPYGEDELLGWVASYCARGDAQVEPA